MESHKKLLVCSLPITRLSFSIQENQDEFRSNQDLALQITKRQELGTEKFQIEQGCNGLKDQRVTSNSSKEISFSSEISKTDSPAKTPIGLKFQDMKERLQLNFSKTSSERGCDNPKPICNMSKTLFESNSPQESLFEEFYCHYRNNEIIDELSLLRKNQQDGVYLTPSLKSLQIWFGVIFVRDGLYDEGIFHFNIYLSDDFPAAKPVFRFKSKIFHPQIEQCKGILNFRNFFENHGRRRTRVWEMVRYARSCFYHLDIKNSVNKEAAELLENDFNKFKARCRSSVLESLLEFEDQRHQVKQEAENPLRCTILTDDVIKVVKKILVNKKLRMNEETSLYFWAKNQLGKVLNNINYYTSFERDRDPASSG